MAVEVSRVDCCKILVVDDEDAILDACKHILHGYGSLYFAHNDREAMDIFCRERPRVVIMDLSLGPNSLNGDDLCRQMVAIQPKTRVICVSGRFDIFDLEEVAKAGFYRVIVKPFEVEELQRVVMEAFGDG